MSVVGFSSTLYAWDDCPHGLENDEYPGMCGRYIDTDGDGICDHSQTAPEVRSSTEDAVLEETIEADVQNLEEVEIEETGATQEDLADLITGQDLKTKTVQEIADLYGIDAGVYAQALSDYYGLTVATDESFQILHDNAGLEPSVAKDIAVALASEEMVQQRPPVEDGDREGGHDYYLVPITLGLVLLYMLTMLLVQVKKISLVTHRRFWNIILLLALVLSGGLGILLVVRMTYGIAFSLPFNMVYWHVLSGIVLFVVSVLHVVEHRAFFFAMLKK